jgi:hypothetical protein
MNRGEIGFREAVAEIIGGIVLSAFISAIIAISSQTNPGLSILFGLIGIFSSIALSLTLTKASVSYLFGWIIGIILLTSAGIVGILELVLYLVIPIGVLILRLSFWLKKENFI